MDKLVKKEVLTVYISQFAMIAVALFCCLVPLFSDSLYLTGWKAISDRNVGNKSLQVTISCRIKYLCKRFNFEYLIYKPWQGL